MTFDVEKIRRDFPILSQTMNGKPLVYLDSASSAQKPQCVIDAMGDLYAKSYANIHRGLYAYSQETTQKFELVREKVRDFIHARTANEIIYTRNTTEAINLVAQSWGRQNLKSGDNIILTEMEHHANIVPWQLLQQDIGFEIRVIPVTGNGMLEVTALDSLLDDRTKFMGVVHISNALGTMNPVKDLVEHVKYFNADIITLIDGTQSVVHQSVDVQHIGCDFFAFTGHKLYGPNGIGILYGREDILNAMPPYQGGGDMIDRVSFDGTTFKDAPAKFEAGTPAIAEVIALGEAIEYISRLDINTLMAHEHQLYGRMNEALKNLEGITLYGDHDETIALVSFTADWAHISDIAMILDQCGVAVRSGHHCCMPLMHKYGIDGTIRASLGIYSNDNDVDVFIESIKKAKELLA